MKPLSLREALQSVDEKYADLAESVGVDASTAWKWASTNPKYVETEPRASQLDLIGRFCRLNPQQQARLALWFKERKEGRAHP